MGEYLGMKSNSLKNGLSIVVMLIVAQFMTLSAFAQENIISNIVISKSKNKVSSYELNIDSTEESQYKAHIENDDSIYFDIKNATLAPGAGTIYDNVVDIDNVVVKEIAKNKVRIYMQGKNARNTELVFINSEFLPANNNSKQDVINRPISDYHPVNADLDDQNDIQEWDDNSFNASHLGFMLLKSLKDGSMGTILILLSIVAIFVFIVRMLAAKISQDSEPLIGLTNSNVEAKKAKALVEENPYDIEKISQRNETLKRAQEELKKAHQKYQNYLQNKYKGMDTRKTADIDLIKQGLALQRYQKSSQNPYLDQQVLKMKKENTSSFQENGNFQIPPRPKAFQRSEYIQRPKTTVQLKKPVNSNVSKNQTNMKFLESVTKIYEQSGRGDLANELKNSIIKAKQSI